VSDKPRIKASSRGGYVTGDSFQNVIARLGIGTANLSSGASYGYHPITRNRQQLDWMYRGSWLVGRAVDAPADDATKAGIKIKGELKPDQIEDIQSSLRGKGIWQSISNACRWSRLYGGAVGLFLIRGQDLSTPLRLDTIGRDSFAGIYVLDRWQLTPSLSELIEEPGPTLGQPEWYLVNAGVPMGGSRIHHTRLIRLDGLELTYWERQAEMGWGLSVLERLYDRLVAFDSTTTGVAQLVYKAHLRVMQIKDLRKAIAAGGRAIEGVMKNLEMIRGMQSSEGMTVIDAEDVFTPHTYSFAGLSDVMLQFAQQLSGALEIPMVRLFGQTPTGLNTNGESDLRTYYDGINQYQESTLRGPVAKVLHIEYWSRYQQAPPDDYDFEFEPLWQLTDIQKSEVAERVGRTVSDAFDKGIIDRGIALKELRSSAEATGIFGQITDEDITEAAAEPPPPPEGFGAPNELGGQPAALDPGGDGGAEAGSAGETPSPPHAIRASGDPQSSGASLTPGVAHLELRTPWADIRARRG
jgi:phage-related protein (TIGR01555 family)